MNAEEKSRYFEEVARSLQRGGFVVEAVDGEGLLPIRWQGQPLCKVTAEGSVRYTPGEIKGDAGNEVICQVADIAKITSEYMALMKAAPPLKAKGLESGYRLLAEFNGAVLAGQPTKYGVQFVTWERDFDKTGLCWGHYHGENYAKAKQDFATRSGMICESRLFSDKQLAAIFDACQCVQVNDPPVNSGHEELLKELIHQIETELPNVIDLANELTQRPKEKPQGTFSMDQQF